MTVEDVSNEHERRKIVRKQRLDGKEYTASELVTALRCRKNRPGHAVVWNLLSPEVTTAEEKLNDENVKYDKAVVRCLGCGDVHDSKTINVPNFAKSHFHNHQTNPVCKKAQAAEAKLQQAIDFGQAIESDQQKLNAFAVDPQRQQEARAELAMFFYTSNTAPGRADNAHLQRCFAILGVAVPECRDLRGCFLDTATAKVKEHVLNSIKDRNYAIVTDGWSKRTAVRGASLINVIICPDDGRAIFWRVEDASDQIKDKDYVVQLHQTLREEIEAVVPEAHFIGYVMDSTATNVAAMKVLRGLDPSILVLPCASHALSNLIKHTAKNFSWLDTVYESSCTLTEKLISSQKLRAVLHEVQVSEYGKVRGICAHVPTRFGSRHLVLRDVLRSEAALRKLPATAEWRKALGDSPGMKHDS